jgi:hypothetical protein
MFVSTHIFSYAFSVVLDCDISCEVEERATLEKVALYCPCAGRARLQRALTPTIIIYYKYLHIAVPYILYLSYFMLPSILYYLVPQEEVKTPIIS